MSTAQARRLVDVGAEFPVVSLYLDLDPERFATPAARSSQIRSLLDGARRDVERDDSLSHDERQALRQDLERIDGFLGSSEPPFAGARALAVFCSVRDELFDVVQLFRPCDGFVVIDRTPYIEPLVRGAQSRRWCVALVSRRAARVLSGPADRLEERQRIEDNVHGQHDQGGWSQPRYQRSIEKEAADHFRRVSEMLYRRWQREQFDRLALGGPVEAVAALRGFLRDELRPLLTDRRVDVDVATANEDGIRAAVARLVDEDERERERDALDRLAAGTARAGGENSVGPRAAAGLEPSLMALAERRVETLLLAPDFERSGGRCPTCGLLSESPGAACPADGTPVERVEHLREAMVESALAQDAEVIAVRHFADRAPLEGVAVLHRF